MRDYYRLVIKVILTDADGNIREDINEAIFQEKLALPHIRKRNNLSEVGGTPLTAKDMLKILDKD
jgi:hypothetical protein